MRASRQAQVSDSFEESDSQVQETMGCANQKPCRDILARGF